MATRTRTFGAEGTAWPAGTERAERARARAWTQALVSTDRDGAALLLRSALALVIFPHGAQKLLGWFGGFGLQGTLGYFTGTLGVPLALAWLAIAAEFLGPLALLAGAFTRLAASGIAVTMLVSAALGLVWADPAAAFLPSGFFMNWFGQRTGEGLEFHILALALSLALVVRGGGALSVDRRLFRRS
jgi:putative oxidoreductase